jgi:uncharacterized cupredoxin-like copper-binding protein
MSATPFLAALSVMLLINTSAVDAATPAQSLEVKLQDPTTDPSIANMRIVLDHATIKSGRVTLHADNQSRSLTHEVIVVRDNGNSQPPFDAKHDRIVESKLHSLGEIPDLKPGKKGSLTLNLKPGTYLLFCNQPAHYKDGMVTKLTVTS